MPRTIRTKIACTIGPASISPEILGELVNNGMSIARVNMAYCDQRFAVEVVNSLRHHLKAIKTSTQVAVLLDLNGNKPRLGNIAGDSIKLTEGSTITFNLSDPKLVGTPQEVYASIPTSCVGVADKIYVDDGKLSLSVMQVNEEQQKIVCNVDNDGKLSSHKGINVPFCQPPEWFGLSENDVRDILFAVKLEVDFITLSCIRSEREVMEVRKILGNSKIKILSKIENKDGMENFESILRVSDGIIMDRGYLGVEVDITKIAIIQKDIIQRCQLAGKPVLLANQLLESMVKTPKPSRSESSDVTSGVVDGADGLILSSETAIGSYPSEALYWLRKICFEAERHIDYDSVQQAIMRAIPKPISVPESIACSAVKCAHEVRAACIFVYTVGGGTGRLLSKYKPAIPVIVTTNNLMTARQMKASFGLISFFHPDNNIREEESALKKATAFALELRLIQPGDNVVILSGGLVGLEAGKTTAMRVVTIQ